MKFRENKTLAKIFEFTVCTDHYNTDLRITNQPYLTINTHAPISTLRTGASLTGYFMGCLHTMNRFLVNVVLLFIDMDL